MWKCQKSNGDEDLGFEVEIVEFDGNNLVKFRIILIFSTVFRKLEKIMIENFKAKLQNFVFIGCSSQTQ